jgi:glycosyltransferase involved in cell wall biosynthesis
VVASRAGGIPEVVADGVSGLLVPVGEAAPLAAALSALAADGPLLARLAAGARQEVASRFDADRTAAAWAALVPAGGAAGRPT